MNIKIPTELQNKIIIGVPYQKGSIHMVTFNNKLTSHIWILKAKTIEKLTEKVQRMLDNAHYKNL